MRRKLGRGPTRKIADATSSHGVTFPPHYPRPSKPDVGKPLVKRARLAGLETEHAELS